MESIILQVILIITTVCCGIGWLVSHLKVAKLSSVVESVRNGSSLDEAMEDYGVSRDSQGRLQLLGKSKKLINA